MRRSLVTTVVLFARDHDRGEQLGGALRFSDVDLSCKPRLLGVYQGGSRELRPPSPVGREGQFLI